ncbi:hypothetical protein ACFV99_20580 [Streptomyces sp. NPDC059944]|uniref:hypothetical protein n=1 Tax=unclassified Streptomyces TaxID=2593676 RepID=UPI003656A218
MVALLLLPAHGALLYAMDRLEDRVLNDAPAYSARHARSRHLRLIKGAEVDAVVPERTRLAERQGERQADAA